MKQHEELDRAETETEAEAEEPPTYHTPQFRRLGQLSDLTQGPGGPLEDGMMAGSEDPPT